MYQSDLTKGIRGDLALGTTLTGTDQRGDTVTVIIGETDTVAFRDSHGWHVATDVVWDFVPDFDADLCPESGDGDHQVTDGSCDQCGAKNFN